MNNRKQFKEIMSMIQETRAHIEEWKQKRNEAMRNDKFVEEQLAETNIRTLYDTLEQYIELYEDFFQNAV